MNINNPLHLYRMLQTDKNQERLHSVKCSFRFINYTQVTLLPRSKTKVRYNASIYIFTELLFTGFTENKSLGCTL